MNVTTGLQEYEEVVRVSRISRPALQRAFRTLMQRQFVFADDHGSRDVYEVLVDEHVRPYAEKFFDSLGWRLQYQTSGNFRMVCLMPPLGESPEIPRDKREAYHAATLRVDEAIAILLLRVFYEDAIHSAGLVEGHAECHTDVLYDMWQKQTKKEPPAKGRMLDILRFLKSHGLIQASLPPTFHDGLPFKIRPPIAFVTAMEPLEALKRYAKAARVEQEAQQEGADATAETAEASQ